MTTLPPLDASLDPVTVGPKAATLGRLRAAGFDVPNGFVVEAWAPNDRSRLAAAIDDLHAESFAIRSSGLDEDGAQSSMAGRYESYLSVSTSEVPTAIDRCRASTGSGDRPLPVIVQAMVPASVSGVVFTADPVTGDRSSVLIHATLGLGERLMAGAVDGEEWRVVGRRVRRLRGAEPVLTKRLVRTISRLARRVEAHLDTGPLDIEWAWDGQRIWVVQARPITGLPQAVSWDTEHRGVFHRGFRMGEWIPDPVTPLFESWLLTTLERRMHQIHREVIGQFAPEPHHVVVNGWYFYSLNFLPVPGASLWRSLPRVLRLSLTTPRRVAVMIPQTVIAGYPLYERDWRSELEPAYRRAVRQSEPRIAEASPEELVEIVDRLARLAGDYFASIAVVAGSAYKVETLLAQFWNRRLRRKLHRSHLDLLGGLDDVGFETEEPLLASLDWYIEPNAAIGSQPIDRTSAKERRVAAETAARATLASSGRRLARFEKLLAHAQHLQALREAQMRGLARAWPVMRKAVERIGEALVESGRIDSVEDVFFLRRSEVVDTIGGRPVDTAVIAGRRTERETATRLVPPAWVGRMPIMTRITFVVTNRAFGARKTRAALVSGVPASAGRATGPVRLVHGPADFDLVRPGDVVVAPLTAPAWTPLFAAAAAVVTDVGSGLAHASIIAREFGIPAVVGCGDATRRLTNGQYVTVDGADGSVTPAQRRSVEAESLQNP